MIWYYALKYIYYCTNYIATIVNCRKANLMNKALIITDNLIIASAIEAKLSVAGWANENICINSIIRGNSAFVRHHHCVILIFGIDFIKRFGSNIVEMSAMVRNCSIHTPLYLVFQDDYDPCFASWSQHAKWLFKLAKQAHNLHDAVNKIIHLETASLPYNPLCVPVDSI
jgi:hypothetical protein